MAVSRHSYIAPEGRHYLLLIFIVAIIAQIFIKNWAIGFWLFFILVVFLFRDPVRKSPAAPLAIVSPVHGKVIEITTKHDPFLHREATFLRISMSFYSIFSIRSITEGKVMDQWHQVQNEKNISCPCFAIWIQTDELDDVVLVLRPGRWFKQIKSYFITGERVGQGHRMGYVLFGSYIDVYISNSSSIKVNVATNVSAATDILAQLIHND